MEPLDHNRGRGRGGGGRGGRGGGRGRGNCFNCGAPGHLAKDCPVPGTAKAQPNTNYNGNINSYVPANASATGTFIDTHIHWEYVFEKQKINGPGPYKQFIQRNKMPSNFEGSISIFCDSAAFSSFGVWPDLLQEPNVWGAFGCHPHNAQYYNDSLVEKIVKCMDHPKAIAWGETGLDFKKNASPREVQQIVFADQIQQAVKYKKPLIVHSRDAEAETMKILKQHLPPDWPVHIHCFCDSSEHAEALLKDFTKLYIGVTGSLTFKNSDTLRSTIAKVVPIERILFETDGPYMTPEPFGAKTLCHSGMIPLVAQKLADMKGLSLDEVYLQVRKNTKNVYGI